MKRFETKNPINLCTFSTLLFFLLSITASAQEICDNGVDDDGDGLVDLNDFEDCSCNALQIPLDIIPNPSFEENLCCPDGFGEIPEQECLVDWLPATFGTSDYLNTCGFTTEGLPIPLPDGNGAIGIAAAFIEDPISATEILTLEYMSTCLEEPILPGVEYTLDLSIAATNVNDLGDIFPIDFAELNLTIYGIPDCTVPAPTTGCPESFGWESLGTVVYNPTTNWELVSIGLESSQEFDAIAIGSNCELDASYTFDFDNLIAPYFYLDNLQLFQGGSDQTPPLNVVYSECNETATIAEASLGDSYQWYFEGVAIVGETQAQLTVELDEASDNGIYGVVSTNAEGNCTYQEILVEGLENELVIGSDITTGCPPLVVSFDANLASGGQPLFWTVGDQEIEGLFFELTFEEPGVYPVSAQFTDVNGCVFERVSDPIVVVGNEELTPTFEVLNNCSPYSIQLGVSETVENCVWRLESGEIISNDCDFVYTYQDETDFLVNVESTIEGEDCSSSGSITVPISQVNGGDYSITGQTSFCEGDSSVFTGFPTENTYLWNGSTTGNTFTVTEAGEYSVVITEPDGCEYTDGFTVATLDGPEFNPPSLITGCLDEGLDLSSFTDADFLQFDMPEGEEEIGFRGFITVTATNECGTAQRDIELDLEDCSCRAYVPNAFSPDGDGLNDIFKPEINCDLAQYELVIYNRWGNQVFRSDSQSIGWNGASGDQDFFAQGGIYAYQITYDEALNQLEEPVILRGSVQVLR